MGSLTGLGLLWAGLSSAAALLCCSGLYLPHWIQGRLLNRVDAHFGCFRRCNYPKVTPQATVEIVMQCARYARWKDIPSRWWQASTALVSVAGALAILVAVLALSACCIDHVVHTATARVAGTLQLLAGVLVCGGVAVYPLGWAAPEVRDCCGPHASAYVLGHCRLSWSLVLLCAAAISLFVCFGLSSYASSGSRGVGGAAART